MEADLWIEVATSCFGGMAVPCSYMGLLPRLLIRVATLWLMLRLLPRLYDDNKNVILTLLINGWDLSLILVIRLQ